MELIKQGHELIISHGNGPQLGNLLLQQAEKASTETAEKYVEDAGGGFYNTFKGTIRL